MNDCPKYVEQKKSERKNFTNYSDKEKYYTKIFDTLSQVNEEIYTKNTHCDKLVFSTEIQVASVL